MAHTALSLLLLGWFQQHTLIVRLRLLTTSTIAAIKTFRTGLTNHIG